MNNLELSYCEDCGDLVKYRTETRKVKEMLYGKEIEYEFEFGVCCKCGAEVATTIDYNSRKSRVKCIAFNNLGGKQLRLE